MKQPAIPPPSQIISNAHARRFMLAHQHLFPPRDLAGKKGALSFIRRVGCIQFDPINLVGRNPDLVLQSRLAGYKPELLASLLYEDRRLLDGWDKVASIYLMEDWPYFSRHRDRMRQHHDSSDNPAAEFIPEIKEAIRHEGPVSSLNFKKGSSVQGSWGQSSSVARVALDSLYAMGELGIHHRINTRRVFDLIENLLPEGMLSAQDPNQTDEDYHNWHILRRVGSLGLAHPRSSEAWLGIQGAKSVVRCATLKRLVERGDLIAVGVEGVPGDTFFLRSMDLPTFDQVQSSPPANPGAAIIAPLDNLIWDRTVTNWIFNFEYVWEVYKPKAIRKFGYYVLPVLFGDCFIARFEPVFDKQEKKLVLKHWWWEGGVRPSPELEAALIECFSAFGNYLQAKSVELAADLMGEKSMDWFQAVETY